MRKKYTYGDIYDAYYRYIGASENLEMLYGNNVSAKQLDDYRARQLVIMRYGIQDLLGDYYADDNELLQVVVDYIHNEQDKAICRYCREVTLDDLANLFGGDIIDISDLGK